jgi:hypothetical protein
MTRESKPFQFSLRWMLFVTALSAFAVCAFAYGRTHGLLLTIFLSSLCGALAGLPSPRWTQALACLGGAAGPCIQLVLALVWPAPGGLYDFVHFKDGLFAGMLLYGMLGTLAGCFVGMAVSWIALLWRRRQRRI